MCADNYDSGPSEKSNADNSIIRHETICKVTPMSLFIIGLHRDPRHANVPSHRPDKRIEREESDIR